MTDFVEASKMVIDAYKDSNKLDEFAKHNFLWVASTGDWKVTQKYARCTDLYPPKKLELDDVSMISNLQTLKITFKTGLRKPRKIDMHYSLHERKKKVEKLGYNLATNHIIAADEETSKNEWLCNLKKELRFFEYADPPRFYELKRVIIEEHFDYFSEQFPDFLFEIL